MGASISTRVSLTTTATASAAGPATCAVATTWPTSWTLAPTHCPYSIVSSPIGIRSNGSTAIASVPQRVTSAIGRAWSRTGLPVAAAIAPIADAPQIENPAASRSGSLPGNPARRPSVRVKAKVSSTISTTSSTVSQPSSAISPRLSLRPSKTIPTRISRRAASVRPGRSRPSISGRARRSWPAAMPSTTDTVSSGIAGTTRWITAASTTAAADASSPGMTRAQPTGTGAA